MVRTILRVALHVALFGIAFFTFILGLGVGLAVNPTAGTLLWVVAGLIALANIVWIVVGRRKRIRHGEQTSFLDGKA